MDVVRPATPTQREYNPQLPSPDPVDTIATAIALLTSDQRATLIAKLTGAVLDAKAGEG